MYNATDVYLADPCGVEVQPLAQQRREALHEAPIDTLRLLESFGTLVGEKRLYRYTEERLYAGEPLYALSEFRNSGDDRQGLDAERKQDVMVHKWKGDFHGLLACLDSDDNGELGEREQNRVRPTARPETENRHRANSAVPTRHRLGKPGEAHPFILSSRGEDDLVVQLRRQAAGAALLCLGSALLVGRLFSRLF